jgi:hypothetical protein
MQSHFGRLVRNTFGPMRQRVGFWLITEDNNDESQSLSQFGLSDLEFNRPVSQRYRSHVLGSMFLWVVAMPLQVVLMHFKVNGTFADVVDWWYVMSPLLVAIAVSYLIDLWYWPFTHEGFFTKLSERCYITCMYAPVMVTVALLTARLHGGASSGVIIEYIFLPFWIAQGMMVCVAAMTAGVSHLGNNNARLRMGASADKQKRKHQRILATLFLVFITQVLLSVWDRGNWPLPFSLILVPFWLVALFYTWALGVQAWQGARIAGACLAELVPLGSQIREQCRVQQNLTALWFSLEEPAD